MSRFWLNWMTTWCRAVALFGAVLTLAAFEATDGPVVYLLDIMNGASPLEVTRPLRFAVALMGAVTLGWGLTLLAAVRAADELVERGAAVWRAIAAGVLFWYVVDSALSVATGFALNAVSNTAFLVAFLIPLSRSGVLRPGPRVQRAHA